MKALVTAYHESALCVWCEKTTEAITVQFDGGFLQRSELCFRCFQQSTRVHHKQAGIAPTKKPSPAATNK